MIPRTLLAPAAILWCSPVSAQSSAGSIQGLVVDYSTGAPIAGAEIEPGYYNLDAGHPGFAPATTARKDMPWGALVVGEGQQVGGIVLKLGARP